MAFMMKLNCNLMNGGSGPSFTVTLETIDILKLDLVWLW